MLNISFACDSIFSFSINFQLPDSTTTQTWQVRSQVALFVTLPSELAKGSRAQARIGNFGKETWLATQKIFPVQNTLQKIELCSNHLFAILLFTCQYLSSQDTQAYNMQNSIWKAHNLGFPMCHGCRNCRWRTVWSIHLPSIRSLALIETPEIGFFFWGWELPIIDP